MDVHVVMAIDVCGLTPNVQKPFDLSSELPLDMHDIDLPFLEDAFQTVASEEVAVDCGEGFDIRQSRERATCREIQV